MTDHPVQPDLRAHWHAERCTADDCNIPRLATPPSAYEVGLSPERVATEPAGLRALARGLLKAMEANHDGDIIRAAKALDAALRSPEPVEGPRP